MTGKQGYEYEHIHKCAPAEREPGACLAADITPASPGQQGSSSADLASCCSRDTCGRGAIHAERPVAETHLQLTLLAVALGSARG